MIAEKLVRAATDMGAAQASEFRIKDVVFDERTVLKCLYGCPGGYHYCPTKQDASLLPLYIRMIKKYQYGVLIRTGNLKDGQKITLELEKAAFLAGYHFAFGACECAVCKVCSRVDGQHCRTPKSQRPPLYSLGIDVYNTVRNIGWQLEVVQDRDAPRKNITAVFIE